MATGTRAGPDDVPSWFAVLPDHPAAAAAAAALRAGAEREVPHPSGRPWLLGRWSPYAMTVVREGRAALALSGRYGCGHEQLATAVRRMRSTDDAGVEGARLAGSFHLLATVEGCVRAQGTVSGVRRLYRSTLHGAEVVFDRADVAALLGGGEVDESALALHLLDPPVLHPVTEAPVWRGVADVPPDHAVVWDVDGRAREVRRWRPPAPQMPQAEGAVALREALAAAVEARTGGHTLVGSDLSGLDSTALCCLAACGRTSVAAYTAASPDPLDDDVRWARRTAAAVAGIEHHVVPSDRMPSIYAGLGRADVLLDEPWGGIADHARWLALARRTAARGAAVHLTGFGGDELLVGSHAHLRSLMRRRPAEALHRLRAYSAQYRRPQRSLLRQLRDRTPYATWLDDAAAHLGAVPDGECGPALNWGPPPSLPPWITADAHAALRDRIRSAAQTAAPLDPDRGVHGDVEGLRDAARTLRQLARFAERQGTEAAAPYLDDRVLEAALAVRPEERRTPWSYKPLLREAMRGIVPDESLARDTKSGGICDLDAALRRHRGDVLALWEDSRLARLGLVDADVLRECCLRPLEQSGQGDGGRNGDGRAADGSAGYTGYAAGYDLHSGLYQTLACELWLRSWENAAARPVAESSGGPRRTPLPEPTEGARP